MKQNHFNITAICGLTALAAGVVHYYPFLALALVQLALILAFAAGRLWSLRKSQAYEKTPAEHSGSWKPFFSIQIATYSEPPELVIKTLRSLQNLQGADYEVIVVDNNTPDSALYEPVRTFCEEVGFRFFHFDDVKGAKAGALNLILPKMHQRASHVLVLDADYEAHPDLLVQATRYSSSDCALVQFPQSYRNATDDCPLTHEYASFFDVYMTAADQADSVLSTGTAAVVRVSDLLEVGGWPTTTITEDADLGLILKQHEKETKYVHRPVAEGVMPTVPEDFLKQRSRWIKGNLQVLRKHTLEELSMEGRFSAFLQLTAWTSPLLLFPLIVILGTVKLAVGTPLGEVLPVLLLSYASVGLYQMFLTYFFLMSDTDKPLETRLQAAVLHVGTYWTSLQAVFEGLSGRELSFERTRKDNQRNPGEDSYLSILSPAVILVTIGIGCIRYLDPVVGLGWLLLAFPTFARAYLHYVFSHVYKRS